MDGFFSNPNDSMVPPWFFAAARSGPTTNNKTLLPSWILGASEQGERTEDDSDEHFERIPEFTLFYYPHSFHSQKVMMVLYEKDIPFNLRMVNINLGEQFHDEYLEMNPRAEVPVLKIRATNAILVDSELIIKYLEEQYSPRLGRTRILTPEVDIWKNTHDEFLSKFVCLNIDLLTYGSVMHGKSCLRLNPHYPYDYPPVRLQMQETVKTRAGILRLEAERVEESNPTASDLLKKKAESIDEDYSIFKDIREYETLVLGFESVIDECEAQLQRQADENPDFWLICPFITRADIILTLILQRLWQLGFEKRIFTYQRPQIKRYFKRMKNVRSFQKTFSTESDIIVWPYIVGVVGIALLFTLEVLIRR